MIPHGSVVRKRTGASHHYELYHTIAYLDQPSYVMVDQNGNQFHWAASLTELASQDETLQYWKDKAEWAMRELHAAQERLEKLSNLRPGTHA